ncbi:hypothetical protein DRQ25_06300 [Candidatus Fermentibacteria bacterium]|nr:MAG: hypothetical protein DRQ25_06300 [Candidatus Fermentibacteria bacterium]
MKKILSLFSIFFFLFFSIANASYLGSWKIDDYLTFSCNTHDPDTGVATDAASAPTYRIYEDETASAILTGSTAKIDDGNTIGFYTERIQLTAANGFEKGKSYTVYIAATVDGDAGTMSHNFQIEAEVDSNVVSASNVSANIEQVGGDAIQDNGDGLLEVNVEKWNDTALPADVQAGYPTVIVKDGTGTGEIDTDSGTVLLRPATETQIDEIETDTGTTLENRLIAIEADTDDIGVAGAGLTALVDLVWDETLTGATHNIVTSAGRRLRALASQAIRLETAQAGTASTITLDAGASSTDNIYVGSVIILAEGTGAGQTKTIVAYNGTTKVATINGTWIINPDNTSVFQIWASAHTEHTAHGTAQAGTAGSITLAATGSSTVDDYYNDQLVHLVSGTGANQIRLIGDYNGTSKVALVIPNWATTPDNTTVYHVCAGGRTDVAMVGGTTQTANDNGADINEILTDTDDIGTAGAGLSNVPWNASWDSEVESEANDALVAQELDHLVHVADADNPANDSIVAKLAASDGDWSGYSAASDSLEAIRDRGDAAWVTGAGGTADNATKIADAVWDEARADHTGNNTFGGDALDNDIWTDAKAGYIDEAISGIDDNPWDAVTRTLTALDEDDTTIDLDATIAAVLGGGNGTALTAIPWNSDWDADVQSEVADALDAVIPATPTDGSINSKIKRLRR